MVDYLIQEWETQGNRNIGLFVFSPIYPDSTFFLIIFMLRAAEMTAHHAELILSFVEKKLKSEHDVLGRNRGYPARDSHKIANRNSFGWADNLQPTHVAVLLCVLRTVKGVYGGYNTHIYVFIRNVYKEG